MSLLASRSCTVAFQSRDFLPCVFQFLAKPFDAIKQQPNGPAMSLPVIPQVRLRYWGGCLCFVNWMEIPEDLPREPPGYEEKTTKNDEQTEGEPQSSEDVY
jgi:hypothetical protein